MKLKTIFSIFLLTSSVAQALDMDISLGQGKYQSGVSQNSSFGFYRFGLGQEFIDSETWRFGIAGGLQSGNSMILNLPKAEIDKLGGVPVAVDMKSSWDILATLRSPDFMDDQLFLWAKAGAMYRSMQPDRNTINGVKLWSPEIQAGLGITLTEYTSLNLGYQYVGGKTPTLSVNTASETGILKNIPAQQSIFIGVSLWIS